MTQKTINCKQAYSTPDTSVVLIAQELNFMASGNTTLNDMEYEEIFDEDF